MSQNKGVEQRTLTKADLIESVYERIGLSKRESSELVEDIFNTIKETLLTGEKVKISGFGNFTVREKNSRRGRNPQTGEEMTITARRVLTFRPSQILRANVMGQSADGLLDED